MHLESIPFALDTGRQPRSTLPCTATAGCVGHQPKTAPSAATQNFTVECRCVLADHPRSPLVVLALDVGSGRNI